MDRDALFNADHARVAEGAMAVIDSLQHRTPEVQVAAAAAIFMLINQHYGVRPTDAVTAAGNIIERAGAMTAEFRAVQDYMKYELPR